MPQHLMTVGELRDFLARLPRDLAVMVDDADTLGRAEIIRREITDDPCSGSEGSVVMLWSTGKCED